MHRACARLAVLAALAVAAASCNPQRTQLVVRVDSDLAERDLPNLRMRCAYSWNGTDPIEALTCDQPWHRGTSMAEIALPASFGVLADETRLSEPVTIVVDDTLGALRRIARVDFVRGRALALDLVLRAACRATVTATTDHGCPGARTSCTLSESCEVRGLTCGNDGACRSIDVLPEELHSPDAADATAGTDGAFDGAQAVDAAADARRADVPPG